MNCDVFKNSFYGYLEGQLDSHQRKAFEAHRDSCQACGRLYKVGTELTCRSFVRALDDYLEDRMDSDQKAVFERHLSVCPDCVSFLDSYRRTMALTRAALDAPDARVPEGLPEDLVKAILTSRREEG